jgi:histidinol-phosphate aminotransferase
VKSHIRKSVQNLKPYTPGEQPAIANIVKLNTNENAYPPSPKVAEALREFAADALNRYPDPNGSRLRARLAQLHGCDADCIFIGNGSDEVLRLATGAWVEDDGAIGFFNPSYSLYPVLAAIRDVPGVAIPLPDPQDLPDALAKAALPKPPDLFFIANPNAPTSTHFPQAAVRAFCERFPGVVVIDEAYAAFAEEDCLELATTLPNAVVCRTMSKAWSLAGIRLGYAIGPKNLIDALYKIKDSYNINSLTQTAALAALADPDWMRRNRDRIVATRGRLARELRALGWTVADSATNFLWCKPPASTTATDVMALLRTSGIIVRHFPGPVTGDHVRITIGTDKQTDFLLEVLKKGK